MQVTGFYGGYLNALSQISGVEEANNRIAARNQQMQFAANQERRTAKQEALDDQTRRTLSTAFNTQQQNATTIGQFDLEDQTAGQYRNVGKLVMGTDPKTGLALMREGDQLANQNTGRRLEAARVEVIKQDRLASLAGMVEDQEGLNQYIELKAQNGQIVPPELRSWGPSSKAWLDREAAMGLPASKAADLALRTKKMELDAATEKRKAEQRAEQLALNERREARLQAGGSSKDTTKSLAATTPKSEMAYVSEIQVLNDLDQTGVFGKAAPGLQREAVQDSHLRAKQLVTQNPKLTPEQALAQARAEVLSEFRPAENIFGDPTRARAGKGKTTEPPAHTVVNGITWVRRADGLYYPEN